MEDKTGTLEALIDKVEEYGKTSFELIKLKVIDKTSESISSVVLGTTVLIFAIFFILFLNIAIGFWLGETLGSNFLGFIIVAGFYLLLVLLFSFIFKKGFKKLIGNIVVRKLT